MIKPHILFDNNNLSIKIKNFIKKKLGHYAIAKSDLIVVIGGDGFMLGSLKKYYKYNKKFYGIANYGVKPTFMKKTPILEVHIFNFNEEIYGKKIKVSFLKFIRKEKRFESVEKLKDQIIKDIKLVKKNGIFKNN